MEHSTIQITADVCGHLVPGANHDAVDRLHDEVPAQPPVPPAQPPFAGIEHVFCAGDRGGCAVCPAPLCAEATDAAVTPRIRTAVKTTGHLKEKRGEGTPPTGMTGSTSAVLSATIPRAFSWSSPLRGDRQR